MKQVIISQIEERESGPVYYRARLIEDGNILEGRVKLPIKYRTGKDKIGNIYDLKDQNVRLKTTKKGKKSWIVTPKNEETIPVSKIIDCSNGKYCSILPCNCLRKAG